mgnify:CR=1 FL=1
MQNISKELIPLYSPANTDDVCDILILPGFAANQDDSLVQNLEKLLNTLSMTRIWSFDLYTKNQDQELVYLKDSLERMARDLCEAIQNTGVDNKLIIITHSFAAIPALLTLSMYDIHIAGLVLIDPSLLPVQKTYLDTMFSDHNGDYITKESPSSIVSKKLYGQILTMDSLSLAKDINVPTLIIGAEHGAKEEAIKYQQAVGASAEFICVEGADHLFSNERQLNSLAGAISDFIKRTQE